MSYDPNDPRLTALALGELDPQEAAALEAELADDPEALAELASIREVAALLAGQLGQEELPELTPQELAQIEAAMAGASLPDSSTPGMSEVEQGRSAVEATDEPALQVSEAPTAPSTGAVPEAPTPESQQKVAQVVRFPRWVGPTVGLLAAAAAVTLVARFTLTSYEPPRSIDGRFQDRVMAEAPADPAPAASEAPPVPPEVAMPPEKPVAFTLNTTPTADFKSAENKPVEVPAVPRPTDAPAQQMAQPAGGRTFAFSGNAPANGLIGTGERDKFGGHGAGGQGQFGYLGGDGQVVLAQPGYRNVPGWGPNGDLNGQAGEGEGYDRIEDNPFKSVSSDPLSTFSIDVDTASYANVRRFLNMGQLPPPDAVRIEELINYFDYGYEAPGPNGEAPFSVDVAVTSCPWRPEHRLVRVGLKGREIERQQRPDSNLVFLLDVSGSMEDPAKLPLLQRALGLLVAQLGARDRVSIVVYAGASGLVLDATPGTDKQTIMGSLNRLKAGGSTHGGAGLELAYAVAARNFIPGGANRVILATDGDFNVGPTSRGDLLRLIERQARTGVALTVLGFGMGNLQDSTMEQLADRGNGNYAYIDTLAEARKVLVEQMTGTLVTIAKDVKIQIEFNPTQVAGYRLIGYTNRLLAAQDFNDDRKDAGEIGAGHTVTALYELIPVGRPVPGAPGVDPLKYQQPPTPAPVVDGLSRELMTVKLRYKEPEGHTSRLLERPVVDTGASIAEAHGDLQFAAAVAAFGMALRHDTTGGAIDLDRLLAMAEAGRRVRDPNGHRAEFISLIRLAAPLLR